MTKSRKNSPNYKERMKIIRRFVNFDYDLRKKLNAGQKSAITKAFREITNYRSKRFVPIPRHKSESKTAFKKRRRIIKKTSGQIGPRASLIKGIFTDIPKGAKASIKDTRLVFKTKKFRETIIPSDTLLLADNPTTEAERAWFNHKFDEIYIDYSGFGRSMGFQKDEDEEEEGGAIFEAFLELMNDMSFSYREVLHHAVSGYILRTYIRKNI